MNIIIITAAITITSYLIAFIYTFVLLTIPLLKAKRLQQSDRPLIRLYRGLPLILLNMAITTILSCAPLFFFPELFTTTFPSLGIFLLQLAIVLIFNDAFSYFFHRLNHNVKFLYKWIHSVHHSVGAPFPLDVYYVHPLELMIHSTGAGIGFGLIYLLFGNISIYLLWGYYALIALHEIDLHSGMKSLIFKWLPFYGSTEHHDIHHSHLKGNYASSFCFWDKVFGTTIKAEKKSIDTIKGIKNEK